MQVDLDFVEQLAVLNSVLSAEDGALEVLDLDLQLLDELRNSRFGHQRDDLEDTFIAADSSLRVLHVRTEEVQVQKRLVVGAEDLLQHDEALFTDRLLQCFLRLDNLVRAIID